MVPSKIGRTRVTKDIGKCRYPSGGRRFRRTTCSPIESYRDLLKTAERIIEMNESIQQVENHLSQASKQCNYGYVQKKAANAVMMKAQQHERGKASADNSQV